jgi:glycosyltransferase involved in cell wall biosynthesis
MRSWIQRVKPDLICISNGCFDDNIHLSLACTETGVPYVVIAHANGECMWPCDETGRQVARLYGRALRAYFVADGNRRMLEDQLGISISNAEIVRNPCAIARDAMLPWPDETEGFRLACVGRMDPRSKGQDILLRALARPKWRERPIMVSLFGDGPNKQALMSLAERLDLTERIRFAGYVHDIVHIWKTHHALALPSRYEGLPISIVEAMLCGRPSIVTDVGGNAEIVEDGRSGFVAAWPSDEAFDDAMERAWQARALWPAIGSDAHARAVALLPIDPAADFASKLLELARQARPGTAEGRGQVASATH